MSQKIISIPPWRPIPGKLPMDVQICSWMTCLAAFVFLLSITLAYVFPESSFRESMVLSAWTTSFWIYLGCGLYFADMAVDRQARFEQEMTLEQQSAPTKAHNYESSVKVETTTVTDQCCSRSAWNLQEFRAQIMIKFNPQGHPLQRLMRKASITSAFMIEGLMLVPVILYLGQRLFLPIDDVDYMTTNIPSWSLLFWIISLIGTYTYVYMFEKKKKDGDRTVCDKLQPYSDGSTTCSHSGAA